MLALFDPFIPRHDSLPPSIAWCHTCGREVRGLVGFLGSLAEVIVRGLMLVAGYVSNSSTFPQPLPEEEEAKYLARLQAGDDEARAVLIERNLRLVAHIVKKFDNTGEDTDDLISIGTANVVDLARTSPIFPATERPVV